MSCDYTAVPCVAIAEYCLLNYVVCTIAFVAVFPIQVCSQRYLLFVVR